MLKIDDLTAGLRPLKATDSTDASTTRDPNLRNIMVDDPVTGRRPATTPSDLWNYGGPHQNKSVDDLMFGRHPIGREEARTIMAALNGADYTPLADYSNCWQIADGTSPCTADTQVGKIASTVGTWVATQATAGFKPFLRDKFSYAPVVSAIGETWTFTGTPIAGRAGIRINASGEKYFANGGTTGNFVRTPKTAATDITGSIFLAVKMTPVSFTPATGYCLLSKWTVSGNHRSYRLDLQTNGTLIFYASVDGINLSVATTSATLPTTSPTLWIYVSLLVAGAASKVNFYTSTDGITKTQLGTTATVNIASIFINNHGVTVGATTDAGQSFNGKIHYAAAYANDTGTGTPAYEFYPQRDSVNFPMNPYLDYDGTDDRLETNIAPGSYDAGYLCGGWTQMEALGVANGMFGSSASDAVRGVLSTTGPTGLLRLSRFTGVAGSSAQSSVAIVQSAPFVVDANYVVANAKIRLNGYAEGTDSASRDYRGSTQVALLGATNNAESGITPSAYFHGYQFSQIWLPSIPTDEQQAILRAYCASKAGVTL
jgi:hypothetical protein